MVSQVACGGVGWLDKERNDLGTLETLAPSFTSCENLGKVVNLSVLQLPHW